MCYDVYFALIKLEYVYRQTSNDSDDDAIIGPLPPTADAAQRSKEVIARDFEKRYVIGAR